MDIQDYEKKTTLFGAISPFSEITQTIAQVVVAYFPKKTHQSLALINKEWYAQVRGRLFLFYPLKGQFDRYLIQTTLTHSDLSLLRKQTGIEPTIPPGKQSLEDFTLGKGAFGELKLALTHRGGRYIGIKVTRGKGVERELNIQKALSGIPGLLPLLDSVQEGESLYQVMPLGQLDARKLKVRLDTLTDPLFKEEICCHIAKGLLEALAAMHKRGYYHLDVKPDNLIINAKGEPLLIDFGCTAHTSTSSLLFEEIGGDMRYHAPELKTLTPLKAYKAAPLDSWAAGITLLELAAPSFDFTQEASETLIEGALLEKERFFSYLTQEVLPGFASPEEGSYWELVKSLLNPNPDKRLTSSQAILHPALKAAPSDTVAFLTDLASNPQTDKRPTQAAPPKAQPTKIPKSNFPKGLGYSSELMRSFQNRLPPRDPKEINLFSPQTPPPRHFSAYIERKELQEELRKRLTQQKEGLLVAHGIGGTGKTQLITRIFHDEKVTSHFGTRLWFRSVDSKGSMDSQYLTLAQEWCLVDEKATYEEAIEKVHQKLARDTGCGKPWLIVFDNADAYAPFQPYLPLEGGWAIVTTRNPGWSKVFSIGSLNEEEAIKLSAKLLPKQEQDHPALAKRLDYLPLALVQACAYIRNQQLSIANYLTLLDTNPQQLLSEDQQLLGKDLPSSMIAVWNSTFAILSQKFPKALELLGQIAYLSDQISLSVMGRLTIDPESLLVLQDYSLLELRQEAYSVHRLVQEVSRLRTPPESSPPILESLMDQLNDLYILTPKNPQERALNLQALPHSRSLLGHHQSQQAEPTRSMRTSLLWIANMEDFLGNPRAQIPLLERAVTLTESLEGEKGPEMAICLNNLGMAYHTLGDAKGAIGYYERALVIDEATYGKDHPSVGALLNNLGEAYRVLGDAKGAIGYYERALAINEATCGKQHPSVARDLNNLGLAYHTLGDAKGAIGYYERALAIFEMTYGKEHPDVARGLNNLGEAYRVLGDAKGAIGYYERALAINEATYGKEHPSVARDLNNLGGAYHTLGDAKGAIGYYERALAINEATYGKEHPDVAGDLNNLGGAYHTLGDAKGAIDYFERALAIFEMTYGKEHPDVAKELNSLGSAYEILGDAKGAIGYFERALAIDEATYGKQHPDVARDLNNLGSVYHTLGDAKGAIGYYERALVIDEATYGKDHPSVGALLNNLGEAYRVLGDAKGAIGYYERALAIFEMTYGKEHPDVARGLNNLGGAYHTLRDAKGAIGYYERALAIDEATYGKQHPDVARDLNNLGGAYHTLGDAKGAIGYYERALAIFEITYGKDHPNVGTLLNNLGSAYQTLGDAKGAIVYYERALAVFEKVYGSKHPSTKTVAGNLFQTRQSLSKESQYDVQKGIDTFTEACINGNQSVVESAFHLFSLEKNLYDKEGNPLICWMAQHTMTSVVTHALKKGWSPNLPNKNGIYPLHYAAMKSAELTRILLPYVDPFVQTAKGSTPAMVAKSKGDMETLPLLIPSVGLAFEDSKSFNESYATYQANLLAEQAPSFGDPLEAFTLALHFKDWGFAKEVARKHNLRSFLDRIIKQYPAARERLFKGIKPFTKACLEGDEALALEVIKAFTFEKDLYDEDGHSLISWVAQKGMGQTMEAILTLGWDPDLPNKNGIYPIHYAAMKSVPLTCLLLQAKANPFVTTAKGSTPAMVARSKGNAQTLQTLLPKIEGLSFEDANAFEASYLAYKTIFLESDFKVNNLLLVFELILHLGDVELAKAFSHKAPTKILLEELIQKYSCAKESLAIRCKQLFNNLEEERPWSCRIL